MANNKENQTETISKSKQKREDRQKEVAKLNKSKKVSKAISIIIPVIIVGLILAAIGTNIYKDATRTKASDEYSKDITDEGKIEGVNPLDYITLADYKSLVVPKADVSATDEEIESDINSALESHTELSEDSSLKVADGDKVSIDYVGSIDGVEFEGGNSEGNGYDLTIGSGSFIDTFEEQLIGHVPGEEITVNVTFPEDYQSEDLAGKAAVFAVTLHGIYVQPELTDEFIQTYYSENASTVEEYRTYLADGYYDTKLTQYLTDFINNNTTADKYPNAYIKTLKSLLKGNDEYTLTYYNQMFSQYGMTYDNLWDLSEGIDNEEDYEKDLKNRAEDSCREAMMYQAIFENEGLELDMDGYLAELTEENDEEYVNNMKETYGVGYMAQMRMRDIVVEYLKNNANVQ